MQITRKHRSNTHNSPCTKSIYFDADVLRATTFKYLKIITLTKYMIIFSDVLRAINRVWVIRKGVTGRKRWREAVEGHIKNTDLMDS